MFASLLDSWRPPGQVVNVLDSRLRELNRRNDSRHLFLDHQTRRLHLLSHSPRILHIAGFHVKWSRTLAPFPLCVERIEFPIQYPLRKGLSS